MEEQDFVVVEVVEVVEAEITPDMRGSNAARHHGLLDVETIASWSRTCPTDPPGRI